MALVGVELETKKDRQNGEHRKGRVFIEEAEL